MNHMTKMKLPLSHLFLNLNHGIKSNQLVCLSQVRISIIMDKALMHFLILDLRLHRICLIQARYRLAHTIFLLLVLDIHLLDNKHALSNLDRICA